MSSCRTANLSQNGIVNLSKQWKRLQRRRTRERKEAEEEEWTVQCYAAVFVSVTSFHVWNRACKRARYSPAREICVVAVENVQR